jgi:hypothetical protein
VEFILSLSNRPSLDDLLKLRQTIRQSRGARLQNQRGFDFVEICGLHRVDPRKPWPRRDALRPEFLAAPFESGSAFRGKVSTSGILTWPAGTKRIAV